ncbi:MAG: ABC transporter ATP-binding protein [Candidatus Binataceae bacterium]
MKHTLGAFLRDLKHVTGSRLWWTLALSMTCSLSEGAGLALLLPTLAVAGFSLDHQGGADRYAAIVRSAFLRIGIKPGLLTLLSLLVAILGVRALIERSREIAVWTVRQRFEDVLRRRLYHAIARADWLFITRSRFADFSHALTAELSRVGDAALVTLMLAADIALVVIYTAAALLLSTAVTLSIMSAALLLALALRGKTRRIEQHGADVATTTNQLYAAASDHLQSLKTARTYDASERNFALFASLSERIAAANIAAIREQALASAWFQLAAILMIIPVLYFALRVFGVAPAELLILLLVFVRIMPRFLMIHRGFQNLVKMLPSYANVAALEQRCRAAEEPTAANVPVPSLRHEINLRQVTFSYRPGTAPALRDLAMTIPAGRITAIVGPSGVGKSTITDIAMGLIVPNSGSVTLDGTLLTAATATAWRNQIGYVAQETTLFHLSIRDNLLWACPGADEAAMFDALRLAAAEDFVRALPKGLDTVIGDRGAMLSQGERQRIALARALVRRPALLVLDEATNSLDYDNEARVLGAIEALRGNLTILLVAHRLSAIRYADLIYVIEAGQVAEAGGWEDLNGREGGRFRALCQAHRLVA